jgi:hypothetical protein
MPATVIPVTGLYLGFVGNISNEGYSLRSARQVNPTDTNSIAFGESLVLNSNNTYSSVKTFIQGGGSVTPSSAVGLAASNVNINPAYNVQGTEQSAYSSDFTPGGVYLPGQICDALVQGTINVVCNNGTPTAGGAVYLRTATDSAIPAGVIGGLEAEADPNPITSITITTTNASATATASSATGLEVGMTVVSANLPANTTIIAISGTTLTLSNKATAGASGTAATFGYTVLMPNLQWKTGYLETDLTAQVTILQRQIP